MKAQKKAPAAPAAPGGIRDRIVEFKRIRASLLVPHPKNWRTHPDAQAAALRAVFAEIGVADVCLVRAIAGGKFQIIDGHLRREELTREGGDPEIPCLVLDVTEAEAEKMLLTVDPLAAMARADKDRLLELVKETVFDSPGLTQMMADLAAQYRLPTTLGAGFTDPDDVPAKPDKPKTRPGDTWLLGEHRVSCGDCTVPEVVKFLFSERRADMLCTDPPYGVDLSGKAAFYEAVGAKPSKAASRPIANDARVEKDYREWFASWLRLVPLAEKNTAYVFMSGQELHNLRMAFEDAGFRWGDYLLWIKQMHVLGRKDHSSQHEFVLYGRKDAPRQAQRLEEFVLYGWKGVHRFYGPFRTSVFFCDRPMRSEIHPTVKPVALLADFLSDGSPVHGLVYDAFLGSGSTLIACEATGRVCFGAELDPGYVDVIVSRWCAFTQKEATRLRDGKTWAEVAGSGTEGTKAASARGTRDREAGVGTRPKRRGDGEAEETAEAQATGTRRRRRR